RRVKWTDDYREEVEASIRNHLSRLNPLPVSEITAPLVAPILEAVEDNAPHMLEKVQPRLRAILNYAVELGLLAGNPLPAPSRGEAARVARRHYPAVTDLPGIGKILRDARASDPAKGIQRAHLLLAFTAQRIAEIVGATWS